MKKIPVRLLAGAQNPYVRLHDLIKEKENLEFPFLQSRVCHILITHLWNSYSVSCDAEKQSAR